MLHPGNESNLKVTREMGHLDATGWTMRHFVSILAFAALPGA
jgi:hypothetical protein